MLISFGRDNLVPELVLLRVGLDNNMIAVVRKNCSGYMVYWILITIHLIADMLYQFEVDD